MSSNRIFLNPVLDRQAYIEIDRFCVSRPGISALPEIAAFLTARFGVSVIEATAS